MLISLELPKREPDRSCLINNLKQGTESDDSVGYYPGINFADLPAQTVIWYTSAYICWIESSNLLAGTELDWLVVVHC